MHNFVTLGDNIMPFTITSEADISREYFNGWASKPEPIPKNCLDIVIKGKPYTSLNGRHVYARFDSTYISFYPEKQTICYY